MKKQIKSLMLALMLCSSLCACSSKTETKSRDLEQGSGSVQAGTGDTSVSFGDVQPAAGGTQAASGKGNIQLVSNRYGESACSTESGYYYLTEDTVELRDGNYGMHLMYMDYATGQEVYLCSTAGCKHDSADCPAVFLYDDFQISTKLFVFGDSLYILSADYDDDGSVSSGTATVGGDDTAESEPAVLYQANLDGTGRKKIFTFDPALTIEDKVFGDSQGIYVVTKKLSTDKDGNETYTTSSERKLMFLDLDSLSLSEVCPMEFDDHITWEFVGCYQDDFVLCGTDYGKELSRDERWDDDVYKELYENSSEVYTFLDKDEGTLKEIARQSNRYENSAKIIGDSLYLSSDENQDIEVINIGTGEKKTLCTLRQNFIMDTLGDTLCCRAWDMSENIFYFVDTKTGNISKSPIVNLCNGWAIDFRAETAEDVLFIYDYDATDYKDGSYEIHQYKYALIAKDDLFAGKENYRKIEMIGPGM